MTTRTELRSHRSIGEVLSLLQEEFPDITISKIRFLESQGLLNPERTPSGYRKFFGADIARLRWILHQQRAHYLPLKVIKDRLDETGGGLPGDDDVGGGIAEGGQQSLLSDDAASRSVPTQTSSMPYRVAPPDDDVLTAAQSNGHTGNGAVPPRPPGVTAPRSAPTSTDGGRGAASSESADVPPDGVDPETVSLSLDELAAASGLSVRDIRYLERFGLIEQRDVGEAHYYDSDALTVARIAAGFMQHGIEPRHIRTYRVAVDRESGLYEQIIAPVLKQRNPQARQRAARTVADLIRLGDALRETLLRRELRDHLSGDLP